MQECRVFVGLRRCVRCEQGHLRYLRTALHGGCLKPLLRYRPLTPPPLPARHRHTDHGQWFTLQDLLCCNS